MAAQDSIPSPIKGQAFRIYGCTKSAVTGKVITGGLAFLAGRVSKDGGSFSASTNAPVEIGTTGWWYVDLTDTEMDAYTVCVNVETSTTNAMDASLVIPTADVSFVTSNAWNQAVLRLEQIAIQTHGAACGKLENDGTTITLSLPVGAGTWLSAGVDNGPLAIREQLD